MYLSDSHPSVQLIRQFDYDVDSATPANRRLYVDMNKLPGRPDGAAIDADRCYRICANDAVFALRPGVRGLEEPHFLQFVTCQPEACA